MDQLTCLRAVGLDPACAKGVHPERLRKLAREGERYTAQHLRALSLHAGPLPVAVPATPEEYLAGRRALLGPLADGSVRQAGELAANRRHAQRLAMLPDGLVLEISHHAVPAQGPDSSTSYSAIVGIGRS